MGICLAISAAITYPSKSLSEEAAFALSGHLDVREHPEFSNGRIDCTGLGVTTIKFVGEIHLSNSETVLIKCKNITFDENAYLKFDGSIALVAQNLSSIGSTTLQSLRGVTGTDAPAQVKQPNKSQDGNPGPGGSRGRNASSGVKWEVKNIGLGIKTKVPVPYSHSAHHGGPGKRGGNGIAGKPGFVGITGGDGGNGGSISITAQSLSGQFTLITKGGRGGVGGLGGQGGEGGNGGPGGPGGRGGDGILDHPAKNGGQGGPGGNGGQGGNGGTGGTGGNGGNGGNISIQTVNNVAADFFDIINPGGKGGEGGQGGNPGVGGLRGNGGPGGCGGGSGDPFRGDGKCGGWGGTGVAGGPGTAGGSGAKGADGQPGVVGVLDQKVIPLDDFNSQFSGA